MPRGGKRPGSGRPFKVEGERRQVINCRLKASNKKWLEETKKHTGQSLGELIDLAVEKLMEASP